MAFSDKYYYEHLNQLDPNSKIVVVFNMLDGEDINKSSSYWNDFVI